jgi:hypothetical protein
MNACPHRQLVLVRETHTRLRCRHCHLTLTAADLAGRYCPACFATTHTKRYDFDEVRLADSGRVSYRCEACGRLSTVCGVQEATCWPWGHAAAFPVRVLSRCHPRDGQRRQNGIQSSRESSPRAQDARRPSEGRDDGTALAAVPLQRRSILQFGLLYECQRPFKGTEIDWNTLYKETLAQCELADQVGFNNLWDTVGEPPSIGF